MLSRLVESLAPGNLEAFAFDVAATELKRVPIRELEADDHVPADPR